MANNHKEEFVRKLKDEANKQEIEENLRIEKLEKLFEKFEKQINILDKEKVKIKTTKETLETETEKVKLQTIDIEKHLLEERNKRIKSENKLRRIDRERLIKKKVNKWRRWIFVFLFFSIIFFILSFSICLKNNNNEIIKSLKETIKFESTDDCAIIYFSISSGLFAIFLVFFGIRYINTSAVEAFKKSIEIPEGLEDEKIN